MKNYTEEDTLLFQVILIPVTSFIQNCSILICKKTNQSVVIDPGGDIDHLCKIIKKKSISVKQIWLTHGHIDHCGMAVDLASRLGNISIIGPHEEDKFLFNLLPLQSLQFGFPYTKVFFPDQWLNDNDMVYIGKKPFTVIHCPGHTPGHIVFFNAESKLAIVGDVIFSGSIGRTDLPKGNFYHLIHSIKNKLFVLGKDVKFIPGHGSVSTFGYEEKYNPYLK